ncbi:TolC family protein, partial [Cellvibrio mixtus]|uniref:TolC family protein n=1 Tax=Cellvibrio mixtus TaxID=39650 RepID=UPI0005866705
MSNFRPWGRLACVFIASTLLGACAISPPQTSINTVEQQLGEQFPATKISQNSLGKSTISITRDEPLTLPQTLQILLSHSPQVRIELAQLGIANAAALQAELIENPHISIGALKPEDGGRWQLDTSLSQPLLALFTRPLRRELAQENLLEAQLRLQARLQQLIAQTSEHYFAAVAAMQHCYIQNKLLEATTARQQLALSLYRAGNLSENNFLAYDNELRRARQQMEKRQTIAYEKRLELLNLIGLPSIENIEFAAQLPALPTEKFNHSQLLAQAKTNRTDIKIAQQQLAIVGKRQQLVKQQHGWRDITLGLNAEREFDGANNIGPEVEFALPIFNRGQGKLAEINANKTALAARLQKFELDADKSIAQSLNLMDSARAQINILEPALSVAEKRVDLSNREVNFMLGSPFELLAIKRQQIQLAHEFTDALKNYWQARAQLELAIGQALPSSNNEAKDPRS